MRWLLRDIVIKLLFTALLGLAVWGVAGRRDVWLAWGALILWQLFGLVVEAFRRPATEAEWGLKRKERQAFWMRRRPLQEENDEVDYTRHLAQADAMASREIDKLKAAYVPPRHRFMLLAEALGLLAFLLLLPLALVLSTRDFFSWRQGYSLTDILVLLGCLVLHALPRLRPLNAQPAAVRWCWWAGAFACLLPVVVEQVHTRHPYLDPWNPDHTRLAAEKVLTLHDNVTAGVYADWLADYALQQAKAGHADEAKALCEKALRLSPGLPLALKVLQQTGGGLDKKLLVGLHAPYFATGETPRRAARCRFDADLEKVDACTVILMPMGEIADDVLDYVAAVISHETGMPAAVYENTLRLPPYTRLHGLAYGRQWESDELTKLALKEVGSPPPRAPLRLLVLTSADIYSGNTNYLFSVAYRFGAIVSTARYVEGHVSHTVMCHSLAKQSLGAIIKSFGIEPSPDPRCVTSYTASVDEFNRKGDHPVPATLALLDDKLRAINVPWQRYRASQRR